VGDDSIVRFMRMAAPEDPATWFSVHRRIVYTDGRPPIFPGSAHKTVRTAIKDALYWAQKGHCVYLSQGMFRNPGDKKFGPFPNADRTYPNLVACKNLYMDVDVKAGGYATTAEAAGAMKHFIHNSNLPRPTILVGSGSGGFHIYWTMAQAFDLTTFLNMAGRLINAGQQHGLKFDVQCTRDATRLLRMAGTWNFKHATSEVPATSVSLPYCAKEHIDLAAMQEALAQYPTTTTATPQSKPQSIGGVDTHGLPLSELDDLTGGMKGDFPPVNIDDVAKACPFIFNTLEDHGASLVSDPQWHLVTALACHCEQPSETVHRLCSGNQYYSYEGTEEKLATAQLARQQRDTIGPPKCSYIAQHRPECKTCPNLARDTTPLSLGFTKPIPQPLPTAHGKPSALDLPVGYFRGMDRLIYKHKVDDGGVNIPELVFPYQIIEYSAHIEAGDVKKFVFETVQGEKQVIKRIECGKVANMAAFMEAMYAEVLPLNNNAKATRDFMSFYMEQLQQKNVTMIDIPPFGWSLDTKGDVGFSYAGEFVSPAGRVMCQQPEQGTENYRIVGDTKIWRDLTALILTPDRPDVACMVASAFGAPLVSLSGQLGLLLGLVSPASGIGKSTGLLAGQAVWSSPVVGGMTDTSTYTFAKLATLKHLPVFYDEIKGEKQIQAMTIIAFQLTGGHEKGRADRYGKMRKVNEFKTLLGYAANGSIVQAVREEDKGTDASWLRMFEMNAIVAKTGKSAHATKVSDLLIELEYNHGGIGRDYATFLGQNHDKIKKDLTGFQRKIVAALDADPKVQRFWVAAIATTLAGALYANQLGLAKFPLTPMRDFMFDEFRRMVKEMDDDPSDYTKDRALLNTLGNFLNDKFPRNLILLDRTWTAKGRPPKGYARVLNPKPDGQWGTVEVQIGGDPLVLRISDIAIAQWCTATQRPKANFIRQLQLKVGATRSFGIIGSGSNRGGAAENIWVINAKDTIIEYMLEYAIHNQFLPP
jgi:hypothetical protein